MAIFPIVNNQVQFSTAAPVATDGCIRSILRSATDTVARASVDSGASWANGVFFTSPLGQVVYVDATAGLPAGVQWCNGLPMTSKGEICISSDVPFTWANGLPFAANGALSVVVSA